MKGLRAIGALLIIGTVVAAVLTGQDRDADMLITQAVARPLEGGDLGVFLRIENGGAPDMLMSVTSTAGEVTLYNPLSNSGLPVQTGVSSLASDGAHARLAVSPDHFADGALIPVTLTFAAAGSVQAKARIADRVHAGGADEVGLFGVGDICVVGDGEPAPEIALIVAPDGDGWAVQIKATDFTFSKDLAGRHHVPGTGHGHIYVGGMKLGRLYAPETRIGALPTGIHEIRVTLNTNDHRAYVVGKVPVSASAMIVVD